MNKYTPSKLTKLPDPNVLFIASLSNGETIIEGKGDWKWENGKPSPWNRLIRYAVDKKASINSLSLFTPTGATFTLPPLAGKPRFSAYAKMTPLEKPLDFEVKRFLAREIDAQRISQTEAKVTGVQVAEFYTIAEAIYKDQIIQVWVNELDTKHSWTVIKKI